MALKEAPKPPKVQKPGFWGGSVQTTGCQVQNPVIAKKTLKFASPESGWYAYIFICSLIYHTHQLDNHTIPLGSTRGITPQHFGTFVARPSQLALLNDTARLVVSGSHGNPWANTPLAATQFQEIRAY